MAASANPLTRQCSHCGGTFYPADFKFHVAYGAAYLRGKGASLFEAAQRFGVTKEYLRELGVR